MDIQQLDPTIQLDIRYATANNFTKQAVYPTARCLLREDVAEKLVRVHQKLKESGYGLKIYDGYRPLAVQKKFWSIVSVEDYVADPFKGSRHNRGSAVDVGLVDSKGNEVLMPSGYDDFTEKAHRDYTGASEEALRNRDILEKAMTSEGFIPFPTEWWHFDAPDWEAYPVSDRPLWAWSQNTLKILYGKGEELQLAGFYMAQDYSLYGDINCRFVPMDNGDGVIRALLKGGGDIGMVSLDSLEKNKGVLKDLVVLAALFPDFEGRDAAGILLARKDRLEPDRDSLLSFVCSTAAGLELAGEHPDAAAMAVLRRNQNLTFEACQESVVNLAGRYKVSSPAAVYQETWKKIFGSAIPAPEAAGLGPQIPSSLPVRHLDPVTVSAAGGLLPLADALTVGTDKVFDTQGVVVKTGTDATGARLVARGLCDFALVNANLVTETGDGEGRIAGETDPVRVVATIGHGSSGKLLLIASREVPQPWIEGWKSVIAGRSDDLEMDFPKYFASPEASSEETALDHLISKMTLEEKVGQMLMVSFRKWQDQDVTEINSEIAKTIEKYHLGGVILFRENVVGTEQTARLVDQLQKAAGNIPLFVAIDQEGGLVVRLQSGTTMPGNMALGAAGSKEDAYLVGKAIGEELNALGINVDLAPVVDVNNNPDNPVIGIRSFGSDPQLVADLGIAYIKGLKEAGVISTVKHFPGHGDTDVDSHLGLPSVPHSVSRLKAVELVPFHRAIDHGVDMVMTAHVTFPAIDDTKAISRQDGSEVSVPATLSSKVLTDLVRKEMGFNGVIITDALEMKAITDHFGPEEAVIMAVKAGADIPLMPADLDKAYNGLIAAVRSGEIPEARIDESVKRIIRLKLSRGIVKIEGGKLVPGDKVGISLDERVKTAESIVGSQAHLELEKRVAEKAVTLLKNQDNLLPFKLEEGKSIVFFAPYQEMLDLMTDEFGSILAEKGLKQVDLKGFVYQNLASMTEEQKRAVDASDYVVVVSYSSDVASRTPGEHWVPDFVRSVLDYAASTEKPVAVMAARNPYDIMYMPDVKAYLAVYGGLRGPNIPAGIRVIFGKALPGGSLPVAIPEPGGQGILYEKGSGIFFE